MHHPEDLDTVKIIAEVKNASRETKSISKRLFFNKELLTLGNLEFQTGDEIKVIFSIQRHTGSGIETIPFQENDYIMTEQGLSPSTDLIKGDSASTNLLTWIASTITTPFNFSKESMFLEAHKKKKQGANTLGNVFQQETILMKDIKLELEVRDSDFVQIKSRGHIESCFVKVTLNRSSIVDCLMAQDLTQDAQVIIQTISEDRRSLRFKNQIDLKDFDFDDEIELRLFKPDDVIQVTFINGDDQEFFVTLNCCELPLSLSEKIAWYAQVKTKQVRIDLQLYQDEALIPVSA